MADSMESTWSGIPYQMIREDRHQGRLLTYVAQDRQGRMVSLQALDPVTESNKTPLPREVLDRLRAFLHARAVRVIDAGLTASEQPYLVSEYVEGISLWQRCSLQSPMMTVTRRLGLEHAFQVLAQSADALDAAHRSGLIHGAVEPGAILLPGTQQSAFADPPSDDGVLECKLANFGVAFLVGADPKQQVRAAAMDARSPEVLAGGPATARSDQFSLAAVAYWMLTGCAPFDELSRAFPQKPFPEEDFGRLLPVVEDVLRKAMAESANDRYPTCVEFVACLWEAVAPIPKAAPEGSQPQAPPKASLRAGRVVASEYHIPEQVTAKRFVSDVGGALARRFIATLVSLAIVLIGYGVVKLFHWFQDYIATP
jgi:serine/threonine protein kinase